MGIRRERKEERYKQMKKTSRVVLLICMLVAFTACGKKDVQTADVPESVEDSAIGKEAEVVADKVETPEETIVESQEEIQEEIIAEETPEKPQILSLKQAYSSRYEWQDSVLLLRSEHSNVTMWEGADKYPEIDRVLSEIAGMQARSTDDEADNILSFIKEMGILDADMENFETQVSTSDAQVRRADSVVFSLLTDSYSDYGFIDDFRGMWGSNFDVQTGKELVLSDVILDMEAIPEIVLKELNSHIWAGDLYSETIVEEYFENTPMDGIRWSLDYNGVTFYFGADELSDMAIGGMSATVSFAEYPELFNEKYMNVPKAYMVQLPLDYSFFTDLDGDGTLEELNCTGFYDDAEGVYTDFGIYTDTDGYYHYEELFADDFHPYYVKTEDDNHYIYLFCEQNEGENPHMMLVAYNVYGGIITRVGEMQVAPAYVPSDMYVLPLDPNNMWLDNYDSPNQEPGYYMVGAEGLPVKK